LWAVFILYFAMACFDCISVHCVFVDNDDADDGIFQSETVIVPK